jgi:quinol monooxygenase YgiN
MIRHIVLIKFRAEVDEAAITSLFTELHEIESQLPGILSITSGRSESPEKMERGHMHGFVADFTDWDALQAYQDHPDHQRLGAKLVGGKDGILCFDLAV